LDILQHEFMMLRDGNKLSPFFLNVAGLVRTAALLPSEDASEREIVPGVCTYTIVVKSDRGKTHIDILSNRSTKAYRT
jgi:hypothetical protein